MEQQQFNNNRNQQNQQNIQQPRQQQPQPQPQQQPQQGKREGIYIPRPDTNNPKHMLTLGLVGGAISSPIVIWGVKKIWKSLFGNKNKEDKKQQPAPAAEQ